MEKLFVQLSIIVSLTLMLTACPGEVGTTPDDEAAAHFNSPLITGLAVQGELVNVVLGSELIESDGLSLFNYTPPYLGEGAGDLTTLATSNDSKIIFLNTVDEDTEKPKPEITLLVNNDSVRKLDHLTNTIVVQRHFENTVCEVIPVEKIVSSNDGDQTDYTIIHADYVYVVTAEGSASSDECLITANRKRYFKLPMNYQFDADLRDDSKTVEIEIVTESLAKSKLVLGWVADEDTGESQLNYGYLGYGKDENLLVMYGPSNDLDDVLWSQERNVQEFTVLTLSDGQVTPGHLFELTQLANYHYMLQLGLDVFVFNAGTELFSRVTDENNRIDNILSDRAFKMEAKVLESNTSSNEYIASVMIRHDDDELIIVDGARIFTLDYLNGFTPPTNASEYTVRKPILNRSHTNQLSEYKPFSQFDLTSCESYKVDEDGEDVDSADVATGLVDSEDCDTAHNLLSSTWQFITDCDPDLGCPAVEAIDDNCITLAQNLETPSPSLPSPDHQDICTPSDFTHLSELDQSDNDVQFRGFMQYDDKFIDELDFILENNSLFITARMNQKDVLLRYFYQEELTAPKSSRELVLFGDRIEHFALDAYIENNNLFVSSLLRASTRSHECYKNYQMVGCNDGSASACTAQEIESKICSSQYQEFSSHALFCSASQLSSGLCSDIQLLPNNELSVEDSTHDAKWIALYDETFNEVIGATANREMFLLSGLESGVTDEGVLLNPELLSIDNSTGEINKVLGPLPPALINDVVGTVSGSVESIIGGWIERDIDDGLGFGHFQIIPQEVYQTGNVNDTTISSVIQNFIVKDGASTQVQNFANKIPLESDSNGESIDDTNVVLEYMLYFFDRPITTTE